MLLGAAAMLLQVLAASRTEDARPQRDARVAQMRFESFRRMHLPREWGRHGSTRWCDARIGRFCYWYDSTESRVIPEPREIAGARARLLAALDSAAARTPDDPWIAGQRTRYLIEAGERERALSAARSCGADRWWCAALEGLALHSDERYAAADSAFATALRLMPDTLRCAWYDLSLLLTDAVARELSRSSCDERVALANRLWTLSQPLWSRPRAGNDLRTEHFARLTMAAIMTRSANAHGLAWGDDSRELLLRYGWDEWYTRQDPDPGSLALPTVTGHDREPAYFFFPQLTSLRSTPRISPTDWQFRAAQARTRYSPRHLARLVELKHQLTRFPRGDSMLVRVDVAVSDTALVNDSLSAYLGTYHHGTLRIAASRTRMLWLSLPNDTALASIEVLGVKSKGAARERYTIDPLSVAGGWSLSDLFLFDASDVMSTDSPLERPSALAAIPKDAPLGVFWELQGEPGPVWLTLAIEPVKVSLARRLVTRLHLAREASAVRLRWRTVLRNALQSEHVSLGLPRSARGRYRVLLTVEPQARSGQTLSSAREIDVVP